MALSTGYGSRAALAGMGRSQLFSNNVLGRFNHLFQSQVCGIDQDCIGCWNEWRNRAGAIALISGAHFRENSSRRLRGGRLMETAVAANFRRGVEKDLYVRIWEDSGTDVAAFHYHSSRGAEIALLAYHPLADSRVNRDSRGCFRDILFSNALRDVHVIELHAIAVNLWLESDFGIPGQIDESFFV